MADPSMLAAKIKLLVLDVDGVLTDGGLYYDDEGRVSKRFNVQDGLGIKIAQKSGLDIAVITGLNQPVVELRIRELGITEYHPGHHDKAPVLQDICKKKGIDLDECAYLGDDWVDITVMKLVGLPMTVPNARPELFDLALWTSKRNGGDGAVRDAIDFILKATGAFDAAWSAWSGV
ncbi:MAG: HAD-IIIA family hydrolase [Proteobacteria bacterium]|nr:HAD-IIIA family hydrolase [Pseudomonadota bacterium]